MSEVVVTLERARADGVRPHADLATPRELRGRARRRPGAAQANILAAIPTARVRWRYRLVADGFALVVPTADVELLSAHVPGDRRGLADDHLPLARDDVRSPSAQRRSIERRGPRSIEAESLWGPSLADRRQRHQDRRSSTTGIEASHPYLRAAGMSYPPGIPKGLTGCDDARRSSSRAPSPRPTAPTATPRRRSTPRRTAPSTPRTSRASPPATTTPPTATLPALGRRAQGLPRQLQGAHDPDPRLRTRRQLARDHRRDRGGRRATA